jgi:hypothetical protein
MTSIEIIRDLANTAIDRQQEQLNLVLQLVDDDSEQLTVTMLCLAGAIGHASAMLERNHYIKTGKQLGDDDAVLAVLQKLAAVLVTKKTAHESTG